MRARKVSAQTVNRLKDEIYRQMLRLEGGHRSAQTPLAVALIHAWQTLDGQPADCAPRQWLRKLSPVCVDMIEKRFPSECNTCVSDRPAGRGYGFTEQEAVRNKG